MKPILPLAWSVLALLMVACGNPKPVPTAGNLAPANGTNFYLFVSNQSFSNTPVDISVSIDGTRVVQQEFHVRNQHDWHQFGFALPPGPHRITAASVKGGATLSTNFTLTVPKSSAIIDYWYNPSQRGSARGLSFYFQHGTPYFD